MNGHLTAPPVEAYRQNGFHYPIDVMEFDAAARHVVALEAAEAKYGPMHYRVKPYLLMTSAWAIATKPRLLDAVESIRLAQIRPAHVALAS